MSSWFDWIKKTPKVFRGHTSECVFSFIAIYPPIHLSKYPSIIYLPYLYYFSSCCYQTPDWKKNHLDGIKDYFGWVRRWGKHSSGVAWPVILSAEKYRKENTSIPIVFSFYAVRAAAQGMILDILSMGFLFSA